MAAETIKGITISIGGDTTGLQTAIADVNKKSRDLASELKQVEKLLKMDPGNTELLAQKQKLLAEAVDNTKEKLERLHKAQEQVNEQFAKGEISEGQYRAFQRELVKTKSELEKFEQKLDEAGQASTEMGADLDKAGRKLDELGEHARSAGDKLKNIGSTMSTGITAPITGALVLATEGSEEFREELAKLETNAQMAGQGMEELDTAMKEMYAVTGELDSNVEGLSNILAAGFKGEQLTAMVDQLAGAAIKFKDTLKFEGIADGLQETLATGAAVGPFEEVLTRTGVALDDFNAGLTEAIKNGTQQQYVLDVLAKEGLADVYEAYRKNNAKLVESKEASYEYQQAMADLGNTLVPIITSIQQSVTGLIDAFSALPEGTQDFFINLALIAAAIGPILFALGQLVGLIGGLATLFGTGGALGGVGAAVGGVAGGLGAAIAGILPILAALAAAFLVGFQIGKLLVENIDGISAALTGLGKRISTLLKDTTKRFKEFFDGLIEFFQQRWEDLLEGWNEGMAAMNAALSEFGKQIKELWQGLWDGVFNFFSNSIKNILTATTYIVVLLVQKWLAFKDNMIEIWGAITGAIFDYVNKIIGFVNKVIETLNSIQVTIPDWVPEFGGKEFSLNLNYIDPLNKEKDLLTAKQVRDNQKIEIFGKIAVDGVTSEGELLKSVDLIWDGILERLTKEVRA
jgi:phage-related minor tail protein